MKSEISFQIDEDAASVYVSKIFPAKVPAVWEAFTTKEKLDQWWGPQPWHCETLQFSFAEGGKWLYAMVSPKGERQYAGAEYDEIKLYRSFDCAEYFAKESGETLSNMPFRKTVYGFTGVEEGTKLTCNIHFKDKSELQKLLGMGFEAGFNVGLTQLAGLLTQEF